MSDYKSIKEIKDKEMKKNLYILIAEDLLFASTLKYDIEKYLVDDKCTLEVADAVDEICKLIFGLVLDTAELPYEISDTILEKNNLWVIIDRNIYISVEECKSLDEVTEIIEDYVAKDVNADLSRVAVILGQQIDFALAPGKAGIPVIDTDVYG